MYLLNDISDNLIAITYNREVYTKEKYNLMVTSVYTFIYIEVSDLDDKDSNRILIPLDKCVLEISKVE